MDMETPLRRGMGLGATTFWLSASRAAARQPGARLGPYAQVVDVAERFAGLARAEAVGGTNYLWVGDGDGRARVGVDDIKFGRHRVLWDDVNESTWASFGRITTTGSAAWSTWRSGSSGGYRRVPTRESPSAFRCVAKRSSRRMSAGGRRRPRLTNMPRRSLRC